MTSISWNLLSTYIHIFHKIYLLKIFISGNVCCSAYPIEQMDSINSASGELQTESALNLIVFGVSIIYLSKCNTLWAQSFTPWLADLHQDISRVCSFSRCLNGTIPLRNCSVKTLHWYINE